MERRAALDRLCRQQPQWALLLRYTQVDARRMCITANDTSSTLRAFGVLEKRVRISSIIMYDAYVWQLVNCQAALPLLLRTLRRCGRSLIFHGLGSKRQLLQVRNHVLCK
jgi:hypothetical protein